MAKKTSAFDALRAGATATKSVAKESSVPTLVAPPEISQAIIDWNKANEALEAAEARVADAEGRIYDPAAQCRVKYCQDQGKVQPSIRLTAKDGEQIKAIKFVQSGRFKKMVADKCQTAIEAEFSEEEFEKFFRVTEEFSFKPDDFTEDEIARMIKALGPDGVAKIKRESVIAPTEAFLTASLLDAKVSQAWDRLRNIGVCEPFKASIQKG